MSDVGARAQSILEHLAGQRDAMVEMLVSLASKESPTDVVAVTASRPAPVLVSFQATAAVPVGPKARWPQPLVGCAVARSTRNTGKTGGAPAFRPGLPFVDLKSGQLSLFVY